MSALRGWMLGLLLLLPLAGGCVGYRLGTTLPPGIRSIYVPSFINRTGEPELEVTTTRATIQEFQRDGTLKMGSEGGADAYLKVTLQEFRLVPLRYSNDQAKTTSEYRLIIIAQVNFYRSTTDEQLSSRRVRGESTFNPGGDLSLAKLNALPEAAEDLGHHIVQTIVEYW